MGVLHLAVDLERAGREKLELVGGLALRPRGEDDKDGVLLLAKADVQDVFVADLPKLLLRIHFQKQVSRLQQPDDQLRSLP